MMHNYYNGKMFARDIKSMLQLEEITIICNDNDRCQYGIHPDYPCEMKEKSQQTQTQSFQYDIERPRDLLPDGVPEPTEGSTFLVPFLGLLRRAAPTVRGGVARGVGVGDGIPNAPLLTTLAAGGVGDSERWRASTRGSVSSAHVSSVGGGSERYRLMTAACTALRSGPGSRLSRFSTTMFSISSERTDMSSREGRAISVGSRKEEGSASGPSAARSSSCI